MCVCVCVSYVVVPTSCRFHLVGYGCMTCIGNSGPLPEPVVQAIDSVRVSAYMCQCSHTSQAYDSCPVAVFVCLSVCIFSFLICLSPSQGDLVAVGVLSGNRNFEGRINPHTRANYLASPLLCIAYALAGTVSIDFETEPLGKT